jgi:rhodanese-related sulfurtransferase
MAASEVPVPLETDVQQVAAQLKSQAGVVLLDCREADEFKLVHIEGAELWPMSQIAGRVEELAQYRNRPVVVHCHHGGRSLKVVAWLREQGFSQAQSMAGGIDAWSREIDPSLPRY